MDNRQLFRQLGIISRQAMMYMNQAASPYQLDNNLFLILNRVVENEGLTQSQLAELVMIDKTTLSRSLKKLEERKLIRKTIDPANKKFKRLYASKQALKVYEQISALEDAYVQKSLAKLTANQQLELEKLLKKIEQAQQE